MTSEQRLERLRGMLTGEIRSPLAPGGVSRQGQTRSNLLTAVALHAAGRFWKGEPATELEGRLLTLMRSEISDDEIKGIGALYRFAVTYSAEPLLLPESVTSLPVTSGYNWADLQKDFRPMLEEMLARPNVVVVDRATVAAGAEIDSPSFVESLKDYGGGVVMLGRTGSQAAAAAGDTTSEAAGERAAPPFPIKLEADSFHVLRVVGDQGGGKDEIYWCSSSGSDKVAGPSFHSQEFGKVQRGQTHTFSAGKRILFEGQVGDWLILQLFCFEADQSNSDWYDALHRQLRDLSKYIFENPAFQIGSQLPGGDLAGWLADINTLGVILMTYLRNEDDLSCSRPFYLDRYDLALLADRGSVDWHFNGIGHHVLKVKYASPQKIPFPVGSLEYVVRSASTWGNRITLDWQSITPPALASYRGKLYVLFNRPDKALMWAYLDNGVWSAPRQVNSEYSDIACSLAVFQDKLWCVHTGTDDTVGYFTFNGSSWSPRARIHGFGSRLAPALAVYQNKLWLTHIGSAGDPHVNSHDGNSWSRPTLDNLGWKLDKPVSMAAGYDGKLWRVAVGMDRKLHASTSSGGTTWSRAAGLSHPVYTAGPTLLGTSGALDLFKRQPDNQGNNSVTTSHYLASQDIWTGTQRLDINPMREIAVTHHNGQVYVMYHRD